MELNYNSQYPSVPLLRERAKKRIPRFAFEYMDGGCNDEVNLHRNSADIRDVQLKPYYLKKYVDSSLETELFGHIYDAPFGVAPVGLQGLMWPRATEILAKAAIAHNIPFILSTVATASIEKVSEITDGKFWFQLYHPREDKLRDDMLKRAWEAGCRVLVILSDVPTFGYRPKEIKNGLAIPPRMTLRNMLQIVGSPQWAMETLLAGQPSFATLKPYMPAKMNLRHLGLFMNKTFNGRLTEDKIKAIRNQWKGKLVLKGVATEEDAQRAIHLGLDGIIVSNHGGRQLDAGESTIRPLARISERYKDQIKVMMDSGMRSGPDVACSLASGAEFTFMGRSFMYGVSALGKDGGHHTMSMMKIQLRQVMEQLCCEKVTELSQHLVK